MKRDRFNVPGRCGPIAVLAMVLAMLAGCVSPCGNSPFAKYDDIKFLEEAYRAHEVKGALPAVTDLNTVLAEKAKR